MVGLLKYPDYGIFRKKKGAEVRRLYTLL